jgi:NAD-dependent dihydropyrimidine dehydrogenase PreA subunit
MSYTITAVCNGCQACVKLCPVDAISGEKKVVHTIDGSVCIECGACGRICPQNAVLDQIGTPCTMVKRSLWAKPRIDREQCMSCTICIDSCPMNCLSLADSTKVKDPHKYPYLKEEKACIGCSFCAIECPVGCISMEMRTW